MDSNRTYSVHRPPVKKIALEEHFTTPALLKYSREEGSIIAPDQMAFVGKAIMDLDGPRIEEMDRYGIDTSILSVTTPGVQVEPDPRIAVRLAKEANDFLAAAIQRHPGRLLGFAHLPMQAPVEAANELERAVEQLGFKGALINGATNGEYYDREKFWPVWERSEALRVPLYLHPANAPDTTAAMKGYPEFAGALWGWIPETATHVLRLIFGGVFDRFPKATLLLGHMGETLPYQFWRLDGRSKLYRLRSIQKTPSEYIRGNIFITISGVFDFPPLQCALLALGSDRVLFSIDYPYESTKDAVEFIEGAPISPLDREKICHLNAERLFGLPPSPE
jgi:2,3-dihydroxybenzoate decarboxylase